MVSGTPTENKRLRVAFDAFLPMSRWGALFQVLHLEHSDLELDWQPTLFPSRDGSLLGGADIGLFVQPPAEPGLRTLTIDSSQMLVVVAVGHPLAERPEVPIEAVLDEPFPGGPELHPGSTAFWTLDDARGGPPLFTSDRVEHAGDGLEVVADARAIATVPAWIAGGLHHPGVVALPLVGAPVVDTRLVWRASDSNPLVHALVDLAADMTGSERGGDRAGEHP
jgi:DNA-binding transcriptional LysR family regulator